MVTIDIRGVDSGLEDEIRSRIVLAREIDSEFATSARIRALYRRSVATIGDILKSNGYYQYQISHDLEYREDEWFATFELTPGEAVIISNLNINLTGEGRDNPAMQALVAGFPVTEGETLKHASYESGKRRFQTLAREQGYFDAVFSKHEVMVDVEAGTARIELEYSTGVRYHFGEVRLDDTVVNHELLAQRIPFKAGDPYDANKLITLSQNLRNSNYFDEVIVTPLVDQPMEHQIPVTVTLRARPRNSYKMGIGYGTDSGPRLLAGWENRYLNRQGHRLESNLKASTTLSILSGNYIIPNFRGGDAEVNLLSSISRETTDTHTSNTYIIGAQHRDMRWGWNEIFSLSYQLENFDVAGVSSNSNLLIPGVTYWKSVSDAPIYTRRGYRLSLAMKGSAHGALSDLGFFQAILNGKYIFPVGDDNRLIARAEAGATVVDNFDELPASIRYFAGGDNSVRGFDIQTLGPANVDGEIIGGKYLATASIEYEHRLRDKISAAVFVDGGNAFNDFSDHFAYSTGIGLRWLTPVGMVRLDLAFGISEDPSTFRLHFNIGPDL